MSDFGSTPPPPPGGYGGPPPPPGGYGAPPPPLGGMGASANHPRGTLILVLGILSLVCCSPLGIAAWLMGNSALHEIDAQPGRYGNRQIVQVGRILGIVGTVLLVLTIVWVFIGGGLAVISSSNN